MPVIQQLARLEQGSSRHDNSAATATATGKNYDFCCGSGRSFGSRRVFEKTWTSNCPPISRCRFNQNNFWRNSCLSALISKTLVTVVYGDLSANRVKVTKRNTQGKTDMSAMSLCPLHQPLSDTTTRVSSSRLTKSNFILPFNSLTFPRFYHSPPTISSNFSRFQVQATILQDEEEKVVVEESFQPKTVSDSNQIGTNEKPPSEEPPSDSSVKWIIKIEQSINIFLTDSVIKILDTLYHDRNYARFFVLETIARVPYFGESRSLFDCAILACVMNTSDATTKCVMRVRYPSSRPLESECVEMALARSGHDDCSYPELIPYHNTRLRDLCVVAFISVLHMYETFGWWRQADYLKVHFAESWNEMHHLLIMEELGGNASWFDRFLAQHIATFYYFMTVVMYAVSPRMAYHFSECVENHAYETYDKFLKAQGDELKNQPAPDIAVKYYTGGDLYLFDEFQTSRDPCSRRPKIENLYDVFLNIRDDEAEHCKTMRACQTHGNLRSPHSKKDVDESGCVIPQDCEGIVDCIKKSVTSPANNP
ncbi:hypothetical protein KSS87_014080 [Heliosperma pusillum]|nr:hypothetical protein KSS87_014080 [Heliosperma pusillum]